jgi:hypothetical protein
VLLKEITGGQHRMLRELSSRISNRLEAEFSELAGPNVGITLRERGKTVVMEVPGALLAQAGTDPTAQEAMRVRIKGRRDRMLFRPPPAPLPKRIEPAGTPGGGYFGSRGGGGPGRRGR